MNPRRIMSRVSLGTVGRARHRRGKSAGSRTSHGRLPDMPASPPEGNSVSRSVDTSSDDQQLFQTIDRYFIGFLALQLLTFALVPLLPLGLAVAALASPLRQSGGRMTALWVLGTVFAAIVVAPFIIGLLDLQFVDESPVHTVNP